MVEDQGTRDLLGRAPQREKTVWAGLPAERLLWLGKHRVEVLVANRDRTFCFLVSEHRGPPVLSMDEVTPRFSLLD